MKCFKVVKNVANCLMLIVQVICVTGYSVNLKMQNEKPLIRFKEDGTLKIVNFSDLHYGEAPHTDWGPAADKKSSNVTKNILEMEHPDFVIFTGDLLTAEEMYPNATEYFAILVAPLVEKNYRWASTYGNHDIGENMTRLDLLKAEQKFQQSYTLQMNASLPGVTNYYLPIYPPDKDEPVMIFWFFDSQGGRTDDGSTGKGQQPEHIDSAVISWFKEESKQVARQWGYLPSLVFFHIPPIEYINIQEHINFNPICSGLVDDDVTPQDNNTGIMQALWEVGDVQAVFVGHDHGTSKCVSKRSANVKLQKYLQEMPGVAFMERYKFVTIDTLDTVRNGGYGSWTRGARVVSLNLTNLTEVNSYIRLEDGRIVDRFPKMVTNNSEKLRQAFRNVTAFMILSVIGGRLNCLRLFDARV